MNPKHLKLLKKAQMLDLSNRVMEASVAYQEFLHREPKHADAWADYAGQLLKLGKLEEAQKACKVALEIHPHQFSARINLGVILMRQDRLEDAERHLRSAVLQDPHRMDAQLFLAECFLNRRDLENAQKVLEVVHQPGAMHGPYAALKFHQAELWAILGLSLLEFQKFDAAEDACRTALQIDPSNLRAQANLGSIQMEQGRLAEAEALFRQLMADHPEDANPRLLLITCLARRGNLSLADQEIAEVLRREPNNFIVHKSIMGTYYSHGRWDKYRAEIERFRAVDPTSAYLDFEQSFVDLLFGDMLQGWKHFEARLTISKKLRLKQRSFAQPAWQGESFEGKTLLLWAEQGFGDTLMFLRYLPLVKARGGKVVVEAQPPLMNVAATCEGADIVIPRAAGWVPFDLQASLMSLPSVFQTELTSIPAEIPYLDVPQEVFHQQAILEHLTQAQGSTRIGLVWAGSPGHGRDAERSLSIGSLAPLAALPGVTWFSFQLGREEIPPLPNLVSLAPLLKDFSDTAYGLSGMDLLITVDTSVAHLAGALGIPTLLLLSFQPDYRWMLDRDDSPWYPTMRLYRQPSYGDWESVIRQVVLDLTQEP